MNAALPIVVIDTETTGLDPAASRLVDLGAVRLGPGLDVADRFSTLVDPGVPLPPAVTRLTGLRDADVRGAPKEHEALLALGAFTAGALLVAHNAEFDREQLAAAARRSGLPPLNNAWLDTLEASLFLFPDLDSHSLSRLADHLGCRRPAHRALPDAETTADLLRHLCGRACELDPVERALLDKARWDLLPRLEALDAPASASGSPHTDTTPSVPTVTECLPVLDVDAWGWAAQIAGDETEPPALATRLPGFRPREGQARLAEAAHEVFSRGGIGLFEAGTGSGKSLAYLLPAAYHSAATGRRVIVSTKTKALQRQLAAHDLPLVAAALPEAWRWTILMGRENYLCRRKLEAAVATQDDLLADEQRLLALAYLSGRARRGDVDLSALPYRALRALPALADLTRELGASRTTCLGRHCPRRRTCFWRLARSRAEAAHLVCVNHALLLTGRESLPAHEDVVIDEAHLLYHEATEAFTEAVDSAALRRLAGEMAAGRSRSLSRRLVALAALADPGAARDLNAAAEACDATARHLPDLSAALGESLRELAGAVSPGGDTPEPHAPTYDVAVWLTAGLREHPHWDAFSAAAALLSEKLRSLSVSSAAAAAVMPEDEPLRTTLLGVAGDAGTAAELLDVLPECSASDHVVWAELSGAEPVAGAGRRVRATGWSLSRAPLTPAPLIRDALWERLRSAVLTSATLTVAGSFEYLRRMTGLDAEPDVIEAVFPSPFDFRRQAALVLEHEPARTWSEQQQTARLGAYLRGLAGVTRGRTLALFTNKRQMQAVAAELHTHMDGEGPIVIAQGTHGSAAAVAEEFRTHPETVLLGVDALWTGQDFPGDTLVCLVIAKLPFPRQDPLFQARRRSCDENGERWFESFYLPEAVLKFRQGCGRLIRTETDRGVIVVLDHRITKQRYGQAFLASLPDIEVTRARPEHLVASVADHLARLGWRSASEEYL